MLTRREFLPSAVLLSATAALRSEPARDTIVDTHLHCFAGGKDARFPYHPDGPYAPDEAATPEHLRKCMDDAGVDFAIVVHPEPYQDDHRYLEHCLAVGGKRLKGTCLFFAGRPDNARRLAEMVRKVPLVALRIHAYNPRRLPPFGKPELRDLWKLAAEHGLAVQLHFEPRYAPGFEPLIEEFKEVRVLIDHLGRPMQGTPEEHAVVVKWARFQNVIMKLSAVPNRGSYPHQDPTEVIRQLFKAFTPDRLMYGGGFDARATGKSYRAERERIIGFLPDCTEADRARILGNNAARIFGLQKS